jgi:peptidoglycan/LPS O-acetylase OafA/YrhL
MVITSHCYGSHDPLALIGGGSKIAMPVFFFLSGLLVAQSLDHSSSKRSFLWKRALRLYPAVFLVILLSACLIGPLITTLPAGTYFSHPLFFQYLRTCFVVQVYYFLPGVFQHSRLGPSVNASLWSLSLELKLYLALALSAFIPKKSRIPLTAMAILILFLIGTFFYSSAEIRLKDLFLANFVLYPYTQLTIYFLTGNLCYYFRRNITICNYWLPIILITWWLGLHSPFSDLAAFLLIPALVLFFSASQNKWIRSIIPKSDLSYGLYLWAFPIQQLVVNYLSPGDLSLRFFLIILFTTPIAFLSWNLVEKPALQSKKRIK